MFPVSSVRHTTTSNYNEPDPAAKMFSDVLTANYIPAIDYTGFTLPAYAKSYALDNGPTSNKEDFVHTVDPNLFQGVDERTKTQVLLLETQDIRIAQKKNQLRKLNSAFFSDLNSATTHKYLNPDFIKSINETQFNKINDLQTAEIQILQSQIDEFKSHRSKRR